LGGRGPRGGCALTYTHKYTDQVFSLLTTTATNSYICIIIATLTNKMTIMCDIYATLGILYLTACTKTGIIKYN